jgi:hemerythrin-like domain-containing protein
MDIFGEAGALLFGHSGDAGADAAQGGGDVVDVIHEADKFSSCGHEGSLRFLWRTGGIGSGTGRAARGNYSLLNMRADLAKEDNRSMLRDPSLIQLSRQHHNALALCVRLERALQAATVDLGAWQLEVHQHYANEVQFHFAAEEKVLFPAAQRFPELAALVEELSAEHERLRNYFLNAEQGTMIHGELEMFAKLLSVHIRKEERQLFESMQKRMRQEELKSLGDELARALEDAVQVCRIGVARTSSQP